MSEDLDPYNVLGLDKSCTVGEVHCTYKRLLRELHPDKVSLLFRNVSNEEKEEALLSIRKAYKQILEDFRQQARQADYPQTIIDYEILGPQDFIHPLGKIEEITLKANMDEEERIIFNNYFQQKQTNAIRVGMGEDPNSAGYCEFDNAREYLHKEQTLEDLKRERDYEIIPQENTLFSQDIVIENPKEYVPTSLNSGDYTLSKIETFEFNSMNQKAPLEGTDLLKALDTTRMTWENSVPRKMFNDFNSTESLDKRLTQMTKDRSELSPN